MHSEYHNSLENRESPRAKNDKKDTQRCNGHKSIPTTVVHHTHQHTFHHEFCIKKKKRTGKEKEKQSKQRVNEKKKKTILSESPRF